MTKNEKDRFCYNSKIKLTKVPPKLKNLRNLCIINRKNENQILIKYNTDKKEDNSTRLIKELIKIIYNHESDIVNHIRKIRDEKNFKIKKNNDNFFHFEGEIGRKNIARILGITYSNFKRNWAQPLCNNENIVFRFKSFFKLFHSTNKYFPKNVRILADKVISQYLEKTGKLNDLRVQIAIIFNSYVNNALGFSDISLLLGKNRMYLNLLSESLKDHLEFEQINKYFTLLSSIFLLEEKTFNTNNIKLKDTNSLSNLKKKSYILILNLMLENKVLNEEFIGEFEVIFYSFIAFAEDKGENFNINDFSREITNNPKGVLFSAKLKDGWKLSIEQCLIIKRLLPPNTKYSRLAKNLLKNYINYRESFRSSEYHIYWHNEEVIRLHCTILTIRNLCFDILNMFPFPVECFKKNFPPEWYTFNRHHIYLADKKSIDPNRIILTITQSHPTHENQTKLIRRLLNWRFKGIKEIPTHYQNIKKGWEKWKMYLKRRENIEKFGIGYFILGYLTDENGRNHFIERFYPSSFDQKRKNIFYLNEQEKKVIVLNLERKIKEVIKDWVDKYPKLIPKLPVYARHILPEQMRIYKYCN